MQILNALEYSETPVKDLFSYIFFRDFNFGEDEEQQTKLLTPDEINEIEADIPVAWSDEEIMFGHELINRTIENAKNLDALIQDFAEHWELERIALIDKILMQIALTELLDFPEIPNKVSINEAIEIAKAYSTSKSGIFINGVLDSLLTKFKEEGKITKKGRGLNES